MGGRITAMRSIISQKWATWPTFLNGATARLTVIDILLQTARDWTREYALAGVERSDCRFTISDQLFLKG